MAEKPILFSGEMVRAILEGRKTQTRRVIKPQPVVPKWTGIDWAEVGADNTIHRRIKCPYGRPGDLLWVRETWSGSTESGYVYKPSEGQRIWYRADNNRPTWADGRWRPSIFMPRWASRITLRVTDVHVERVQDISEADAIAEGIERAETARGETLNWDYDIEDFPDPRLFDPVDSFQTLWDLINAKRGFGWDVNPWVWAVTFEVVQHG